MIASTRLRFGDVVLGALPFLSSIDVTTERELSRPYAPLLIAFTRHDALAVELPRKRGASAEPRETLLQPENLHSCSWTPPCCMLSGSVMDLLRVAACYGARQDWDVRAPTVGCAHNASVFGASCQVGGSILRGVTRWLVNPQCRQDRRTCVNRQRLTNNAFARFLAASVLRCSSRQKRESLQEAE